MVLKQKWQLSFCSWFEVFLLSLFLFSERKFVCVCGGVVSLFMALFLFISQPFSYSSASLPWLYLGALFFSSFSCMSLYTHAYESVKDLLFTKCMIYYLQSPQHNGMHLSSHNKCWASYTVLLLKFTGVNEKNTGVCCISEATGNKPIKTSSFQRFLTLKKMRRKWKILGFFGVDLEINTKACRGLWSNKWFTEGKVGIKLLFFPSRTKEERKFQ